MYSKQFVIASCFAVEGVLVYLSVSILCACFPCVSTGRLDDYKVLHTCVHVHACDTVEIAVRHGLASLVSSL